MKKLLNYDKNLSDKPTSKAMFQRKRSHPFSNTILYKILIRIIEGESVNKICSDADMPSRSTFFDWVAKDISIRQSYELAINMRIVFYADEIIEIADNAFGDYAIDENGKVSINYDNIARAKLRIDARKWHVARMTPRKYGYIRY